ncbi:hypothetical protein HNY73_000306 [Argiope bruennichi]|uniref:Uncharacterized protein n=1 Tax=Argiope bruennichi TaxID=94029 RepID=A0A8T0G028_ARGBR|nr:hypothetical protein HNY73_000306 [Argiope bruennichi]
MQTPETPQMFESSRNQIPQPEIRNQIVQASQTPQMFQPIWNGGAIKGNFQQQQQFQRIQRMESGNNFIPRYGDRYLINPDRNYIENPGFNDDYATSEQEALNNNNIIETQMLPKNDVNRFQNQTNANGEENRIVSRSSNSSPESQGHIKVKLQERDKNTNADSLNTGADVHVGNIGALNPANNIHIEILNASCEADMKRARLEQYLNNYGRKRNVEDSTLKEKSIRNPTETTQKKKKKNIQVKSYKRKAYITLKPTTSNLANALLKKGKKTKSVNYYPRRRFSDRQTLHRSDHPSDFYWDYSPKDEDPLFSDPMNSVESNYEEPSLYYY